ncbi:hypothetical protein T4B_6706 [Trichinella pseudospiralis]|uniref:Uncharacterized protein n=1 Tax=Trichinella pseudospiralis TaxID=6337 RepID=A0A0V1GA35_TRIPS|nr:hypothetical protein T4B_6706 [Trichinella pseudospiralis]
MLVGLKSSLIFASLREAQLRTSGVPPGHVTNVTNQTTELDY